VTEMKPEDQQLRKRLVVQAAGDLLEWAGDVADEIRKRHQGKDEDSWISPDAIGLNERVLIAQVLSSVSLRNDLTGSAMDAAARQAKRKLAEIAKKVATQDAGQPMQPVPYPKMADGELERLRNDLEKMRDQPAATGMGEVAAYAQPDCILSVWHDGRSFIVQYDGPVRLTPRGQNPTGAICGDLAGVIEAARKMLQMFDEPGVGETL
jgi:hypothetical protein